jgi:hypothetical protein
MMILLLGMKKWKSAREDEERDYRDLVRLTGLDALPVIQPRLGISLDACLR